MDNHLAIQTRELTFSYPGGLGPASGIRLVAQGESLGLVGPNGAGKTTLFLCLAGVLLPRTARSWWPASIRETGRNDPSCLPRSASCFRTATINYSMRRCWRTLPLDP